MHCLAALPRGAGHQDDAALIANDPCRGPGDEKHCIDVLAHGVRPTLVVQLGHRHLGRRPNASRVEGKIDAAQRAHGMVDQRRCTCRRGNVGRMTGGRHAKSFATGNHSSGFVLTRAIADADVRTRRSEQPADGRPDATGTAGDNRLLPG